jgi:hypothetical protein
MQTQDIFGPYLWLCTGLAPTIPSAAHKPALSIQSPFSFSVCLQVYLLIHLVFKL